MQIIEHLKRTYELHEVTLMSQMQFLKVRPRIICKDGFSISAQASQYAYCTPRLNLENCEYEEIELGFPNKHEPLLDGYAEDTDYTQTVYPYTPITLVEKVIEKHGGIDEEKTYKGGEIYGNEDE